MSPSRALLAAVALLVASPGCRVTTDFAPVTPVDLRGGVRGVQSGGHATVRDARGDSHDVDVGTAVVAHGDDTAAPAPDGTPTSTPTSDDPGTSFTMGSLARDCAVNRCPIDDAHLTWQLATQSKVPDGNLISGYITAGLMAGAFVGANVACFGTDVCSNGSKTAVVVTDVIFGVTAAALFALWYAWKDYHGS